MVPSDVRCLVGERFHAVHGASAASEYANFCTVRGSEGPRAVLGWRRAADEPLFLEAYLDEPIEHAVARTLGRPIERMGIVEIGAHAATSCIATVRLWEQAARELGDGHEVAVAVLTAPLRTMFARIGLPIFEIAPARRERLADGGHWGRYYDADPVVCAGEITAARTRLHGWSTQRMGARA